MSTTMLALAALLQSTPIPAPVITPVTPGTVTIIPAPFPTPFSSRSDSNADLDAALVAARTSGKHVLVVFGANWCGDCRALDTAMKQGRLKELVEAKFVVVKVDVGRFDRNVDVAQRYGVPLKKGIPTVAVLAADGSASFATSGGELANAREMGEDALVAFFGRPL